MVGAIAPSSGLEAFFSVTQSRSWKTKVTLPCWVSTYLQSGHLQLLWSLILNTWWGSCVLQGGHTDSWGCCQHKVCPVTWSFTQDWSKFLFLEHVLWDPSWTLENANISSCDWEPSLKLQSRDWITVAGRIVRPAWQSQALLRDLSAEPLVRWQRGPWGLSSLQSESFLNLSVNS